MLKYKILLELANRKPEFVDLSCSVRSMARLLQMYTTCRITDCCERKEETPTININLQPSAEEARSSSCLQNLIY